MTSASTPQIARRSFTASRLLRAAAIAGSVAAVANLIVYALAPRVFNFALDIPLMGPGSPVEPLPVFMVPVATLMPTLVATLFLGILIRFTARPVAAFRLVAVIVLLLSFGAPLTLPVALAVRLTLMSMHLIAGSVIIYVLTTQGVMR